MTMNKAVFMGVKVNAEDIPILEKNRDHIEAFKIFCQATVNEEGFGEQDFYALSLGFFIARGVTGDDGIEPFYEAFTLARVCRYSFEYWC